LHAFLDQASDNQTKSDKKTATSLKKHTESRQLGLWCMRIAASAALLYGAVLVIGVFKTRGM
jgi:hypothetical protein